MKKFMLVLGLALIPVAWGWQGPPGLGSAPRTHNPMPPARGMDIPATLITHTSVIIPPPIMRTRVPSSSIMSLLR